MFHLNSKRPSFNRVTTILHTGQGLPLSLLECYIHESVVLPPTTYQVPPYHLQIFSRTPYSATLRHYKNYKLYYKFILLENLPMIKQTLISHN